MNKFKNVIFVDNQSAVMGRLAELTSEMNAFQPDIVVGMHKDVVLEFSEYVRKLSENSEIKNYVILTDRPALFHEQFIPNNVIETTGPKPFKSIVAESKWVFENFGHDRVLSSGRVFLTSDQHFGHRNIIKYCSRPWNSGLDSDGNMVIADDDVSRMDEDMIGRWNSVVGPEDVVYNLGDVIFGNKSRLPDIMRRLNGRKRLVLGNHDSAPKKEDAVKYYMDAGFERVYDRPIIIQDFIILSHFPIQFLPSNSPFYSCYGHVHNSELFQTWTKNSCCVCVERHDYKPVSLDEIKLKYEEMNS